MQTEAMIQKEILDFLESKGFIVTKVNNGTHAVRGGYIRSRNSNKGMADIIGITPGDAEGAVARFIAIEVKRPNGAITNEQKAFKREIEKRGGIAMIVESLGEVIQNLTIENV